MRTGRGAGLVAVQEEMGGEGALEIAYSESMFNVPDAAAALRDYASQGYDLVIAHGTQYGTSLSQLAPDFPETSFAWGTATNTFQAEGISNVFAYQAEAQQGGYVLGTLAALMSESGVIGVSGPVEAGDAKLYGRRQAVRRRLQVRSRERQGRHAGQRLVHRFVLGCVADGRGGRDPRGGRCRYAHRLVAVCGRRDRRR